MPSRRSTTRGFKRTASVLGSRIREAGEKRGFAVSRLLTHWDEIAGAEIAAIAHPVEVSYGRQGFGATLTVLTTGAGAPLVEMQKERLRERVNAAYGYNAISRVRVTQTAAQGFAEARARFAPAKAARPQAAADPKLSERAGRLAAPVRNEDLRRVLERLGRNILSRND